MGEVVAIENLDTATGQQVGIGPTGLAKDRFQPLCGVPDELPAGVRTNTGQTPIDGRDRDADVVGGLIRGVDGGFDATDDGGHEIETSGEEEFSILPWSSRAVEDGIEGIRIEGVLQGAPNRHRHRTLVKESTQHRIC